MLKFILNCSLAFALSIQFAHAGPIEDCQEYAKYGVPGKAGDILCRKGYLLAHDPVRKTPIWVAEHLTEEKASGTIPRKNAFKSDPDLVKGQRAELSDYKKSGYDQGHMAPSADMAWDEVAMAESFYLSNMVPQVGIGMNRGIWKDLEKKVRGWALERGELYIYTGPIYAEPATEIGKNKVAVPSHIYKIVFDPEQEEAIAFIMPNQKLKSSDMLKYIVSVSEIEKQTGLDFLNVITPDIQDLIEGSKSPELWQ